MPKRGIGDRAEAVVEAFAAAKRIPFFAGLQRAAEAPGLATRSLQADPGLRRPDGRPTGRWWPRQARRPDPGSILKASGYLAELTASTDPQDQTRIENLVELVSVAGEFVAAAHAIDLPAGGADDEDADVDLPPEGGLAAGAPEPDDSLPAFLERIALVADSDQLPDADDEGDGVVTLMTLHTAKGLEFDTVFLTGFEDAIFPHQRAMTDPAELQEERRLAYVGITRARQAALPDPGHRPHHVGRAAVQPGQPLHRRDPSPPDRLAPAGGGAHELGIVLCVARTEQVVARATRSATGTKPGDQDRAAAAVGDRVLHTRFGMGHGDRHLRAAGTPPRPMSTSARPA